MCILSVCRKQHHFIRLLRSHLLADYSISLWPWHPFFREHWFRSGIRWTNNEPLGRKAVGNLLALHKHHEFVKSNLKENQSHWVMLWNNIWVLKAFGEGMKVAILCWGSSFAGFLLVFLLKDICVYIYIYLLVLIVIKGVLIFSFTQAFAWQYKPWCAVLNLWKKVCGLVFFQKRQATDYF